MSHDDNPRVGCAITQWDLKDRVGIQKNVQITCNYYKAPYGGEPLYEIGTPCKKSSCKCSELKLCEPNVTTFKETYMQDLDSLSGPESLRRII